MKSKSAVYPFYRNNEEQKKKAFETLATTIFCSSKTNIEYVFTRKQNFSLIPLLNDKTFDETELKAFEDHKRKEYIAMKRIYCLTLYQTTKF